MSKIEIKNLESADDALRALDLAEPCWQHRWIFRGQANNNWELLPSVWREEKDFYTFYNSIEQTILVNIEKRIRKDFAYISFDLEDLSKEKIEKFIKNTVKWCCYVEYENLKLFLFYDIANRAGLKIGNKNLQALKRYSAYRRLSDIPNLGENFIKNFVMYLKGEKYVKPCRLIFDASLPQHHGVPTRVLDWTRDPRKALFFAAYFYSKHRNGQNKKASDREEIQNETKINYITVYAFRKKENANEYCNLILIDDKSLSRYENKFLHQQEGIFTKIDGDFYFMEYGRWPAVEDLFNDTSEKYFDMQKINIRADCIEEILERLDTCNISISTLMPDYNHVAEQAKQKLNLYI